jgi:hypothetical protein
MLPPTIGISPGIIAVENILDKYPSMFCPTIGTAAGVILIE